MSAPIILWFRNDLRLCDNPALVAAAKAAPIIPVFILDDDAAGDWRPGAASRWYLHHALAALDRALGGGLVMRRGAAGAVLAQMMQETGARAVYWNRAYEPWRMARDQKIKAALGMAGRSFHARHIVEPFDLLKTDGTPYRVFTPYYRAWRARLVNARPALGRPEFTLAALGGRGVRRERLGLLPDSDWQSGFLSPVLIGEVGAQDRLANFLDGGLRGYSSGRDFLGAPHASNLSPDLQFGTISAAQIVDALAERRVQHGHDQDVEGFIRQLAWRDFAAHLLYHFPDLPKANYHAKFDQLPWHDDTDALRAWQGGRTGIPIVDAAMRELWQTGVMHNRARMIAASFLTKNLLVDWRDGQSWFWDTLIDADLANNAMGWQWVAGTGIDAAPYFRIFNPVTQGQKFDADGVYVRRFVPELAQLPNQYLHAPWTAPSALLAAAGVRLGAGYPRPIVDLAVSRARALAAFSGLGKGAV